MRLRSYYLKTKPPTKRIQFFVTYERYLQLKMLCLELGLTLQDFIDRLLNAQFKKHEDSKHG